jgi:hypothetical protein
MPAVSVLLEQTSPQFNLDPPGAPLPLARTQYDAGRILLGNESIGEYLRVKDAHAVTLNAAAVTITLFFPFPDAPPVPITLQGSHSFDSGNQVGSISASSVPGMIGTVFTYDGASRTLTLLFP